MKKDPTLPKLELKRWTCQSGPDAMVVFGDPLEGGARVRIEDVLILSPGAGLGFCVGVRKNGGEVWLYNL